VAGARIVLEDLKYSISEEDSKRLRIAIGLRPLEARDTIFSINETGFVLKE
jgi:hypothetical protein